MIHGDDSGQIDEDGFDFLFQVHFIITVGIDKTKCKRSHFISICFNQSSYYSAHILYVILQ